MADESTLSGGVALIGRWHLSQGCERDLERPIHLQRGSVNAGNHSESVKSEGVLSSPLMGPISSAEYTVSGGTDGALIGRWHLSQGCERDLEKPLTRQRGSVSAGNRSESVKSEGSSVHP